MPVEESKNDNYRVLLIEDDFIDEESVRRNLNIAEEEFQLRTARCLQEGVELLRRHEFDALLLDLSLPDSYGLDTVQRMREEFAALPIIVLSGMEDPELEQQSLKLGVQAFLVKGDATGNMLAQALTEGVSTSLTTS